MQDEQDECLGTGESEGSACDEPQRTLHEPREMSGPLLQRSQGPEHIGDATDRGGEGDERDAPQEDIQESGEEGHGCAGGPISLL